MISPHVSRFFEQGNQYIDLLKTDNSSRYKSWEHCYSAFAEYKDKKCREQDARFLSLHLAFYLASWGMYRGSSFLLQKDYTVHSEAVAELLKQDYKELWAINCAALIDDPDKLNKLFLLSNELEKVYTVIRSSTCDSMNRSVPTQSVSRTLITKILMGTLGCTPAYDRFFIEGVRVSGASTTQFNKNGLRRLAKYYVEHEEDFESWRRSVSQGGLEYPQMKVLDMCFWQIGFELENKSQ